MLDQSHGVINHDNSDRRTDYLYRISIKGLVRNEKGEVLVVKEAGRNWWDLPGGGMDHGETIKQAIAREMKEEVNLEGDFSYEIIEVEDPGHVSMQGFWQTRLIFGIKPESMSFTAGEDSDEVAFIDPEIFQNSESDTERLIYQYAMKAAQV